MQRLLYIPFSKGFFQFKQSLEFSFEPINLYLCEHSHLNDVFRLNHLTHTLHFHELISNPFTEKLRTLLNIWSRIHHITECLLAIQDPLSSLLFSFPLNPNVVDPSHKLAALQLAIVEHF